LLPPGASAGSAAGFGAPSPTAPMRAPAAAPHGAPPMGGPGMMPPGAYPGMPPHMFPPGALSSHAFVLHGRCLLRLFLCDPAQDTQDSCRVRFA
jgi:hypothetical protein